MSRHVTFIASLIIVAIISANMVSYFAAGSRDVLVLEKIAVENNYSLVSKDVKSSKLFVLPVSSDLYDKVEKDVTYMLKVSDSDITDSFIIDALNVILFGVTMAGVWILNRKEP